MGLYAFCNLFLRVYLVSRKQMHCLLVLYVHQLGRMWTGSCQQQFLLAMSRLFLCSWEREGEKWFILRLSCLELLLILHLAYGSYFCLLSSFNQLSLLEGMKAIVSTLQINLSLIVPLMWLFSIYFPTWSLFVEVFFFPFNGKNRVSS